MRFYIFSSNTRRGGWKEHGQSPQPPYNTIAPGHICERYGVAPLARTAHIATLALEPQIAQVQMLTIVSSVGVCELSRWVSCTGWRSHRPFGYLIVPDCICLQNHRVFCFSCGALVCTWMETLCCTFRIQLSLELIVYKLLNSLQCGYIWSLWEVLQT